MKAGSINKLCCPECYSDIELMPGYESDEVEIVSGKLRCMSCSAVYAVENGLMFLSRNNHEWRVLQREAAQWADVMKGLGAQEEQYGNLPTPPGPPKKVPDGEFDLNKYWDVEMRMLAWNLDVMRDILKDISHPFVFDIGVQTAWTSRHISNNIPGANVIANDIVPFDECGLGGARRRFFQKDKVYFERLVSDIHWRNIKPGQMDIVYAGMTLHHYEYLQKAIDQLAVCIKPDGVFFAVEPIVNLGIDKYINTVETENWKKHGIREASYYFMDYYQILFSAGFKDIRIYPYFLLDDSVKPDYYDKNLILPYYPMPVRYALQSGTDRKILFDAMASFQFRKFCVPFYVLIYASKERDLGFMDSYFLNSNIRKKRLEESTRYAFYKVAKHSEGPVSAQGTTALGKPETPGFTVNLKIQREEIWAGKTVLKSYPSRLAVDLTSRCNLRCIMCLSNFKPDIERNDLPFEKWEQIRPLLAYADSIVFGSSGEPLLHARITDILRDLQQFPQLFKVLMTNGKLLGRPDIFDLVVCSVDRIGISLEGCTKESYEKIRRGADFDSLIESVRKLADFSRLNGKRPEIVFHTVPMKDNLHELPRLVYLAHKLGVSHIACQHLYCIEGMEDFKKEHGIFDVPEEWNKALHDTIVKADHYGIHLNFPGRLNVNGKIPAKNKSVPDGGFIDDEKNAFIDPGRKCYEPWSYLQVGAGKNPTFSPCCYIETGRIEDFPNIEEIWNSPRIQEVRRGVNSSDVNDWQAECRQCHFKFKK